MRSMRAIAARYDGALAVRTEGQTFYLNVVLPLPD